MKLSGLFLAMMLMSAQNVDAKGGGAAVASAGQAAVAAARNVSIARTASKAGESLRHIVPIATGAAILIDHINAGCENDCEKGISENNIRDVDIPE
jgi:hypothetical protein